MLNASPSSDSPFSCVIQCSNSALPSVWTSGKPFTLSNSKGVFCNAWRFYAYSLSSKKVGLWLFSFGNEGKLGFAYMGLMRL